MHELILSINKNVSPSRIRLQKAKYRILIGNVCNITSNLTNRARNWDDILKHLKVLLLLAKIQGRF